MLGEKAGGVGWQAGWLAVLVMKGCWEKGEELSIEVQVGEREKKRRGSCARVFSGKVPLPLGMGRSLAGLKTHSVFGVPTKIPDLGKRGLPVLEEGMYE